MSPDYSNLLTEAELTAKATWHPKETAPMDDKWCWATDGERVWLVLGHKDGTLRSPEASAVKFWSRDFIPAPPGTPMHF